MRYHAKIALINAILFFTAMTGAVLGLGLAANTETFTASWWMGILFACGGGSIAPITLSTCVLATQECRENGFWEKKQ